MRGRSDESVLIDTLTYLYPVQPPVLTLNTAAGLFLNRKIRILS